MAPSQYFITLQKGITGGFAPVTPSAVYTIQKANSAPSIVIQSAERPDGTPSLLDSAPKSIQSADTGAEKLVDELEGILKSLPTESPPGSQDIYGLDTSIMFGSDNFVWRNNAAEGCENMSETQPTEEQKQQFERAVDIIKELVARGQ